MRNFNETLAAVARIKDMEYRGVEFTIVKAIMRGKWKWTVEVANLGNRSGLAKDREDAGAQARQAISWLLAAKKRQLEDA